MAPFLARITRNLALDRYDYNTADQRNTALTEAFEQLEPWLTVKTGESEAELDSAEINRVLNSFLRKQTLEATVYAVDLHHRRRRRPDDLYPQRIIGRLLRRISDPLPQQLDSPTYRRLLRSKHRLPLYPAMPNLWKMEWYRQKKSAALHRK